VLGNDRFRVGASQVFTTGSFWFSAVSMAASIATVEALREEDGIAAMERAGSRLRSGLQAQADAHGIVVSQTGPVQMPFLTFAGDEEFAMARVFTAEAARRGVYLHPWHNWFLSAAHTDADVDQALLATDDAFAAVRTAFGAG
jgi:glutamate-1-semialdehyde 2,1-aminomutase